MSSFLRNANDAVNIDIATQYLGCLPTISTVGIRWSLPGERLQASTQRFHRDPDDWRCLKFFAYLTDVNLGSGPHLYVKGSNRTAGSLLARSIDEGFIKRTYGNNSIQTVLGRSGTTFIADTHGIHAGPVPTDEPRLMLEIGYSILPIFAFQYTPALIRTAPRVDGYINRLILQR